MLKKIKNAILDSLIWITNIIGTPAMKMLDVLVEREDEIKEMKKLKAKKAAPSMGHFTTTTSTSSQTIMTITPSGHAGIGTTTATINPYTFQSSSFQPSAFSISFNWQNKTKTITLENGEDVLKLADVAAMLMKINNIPYKIKES